MSYFPHTNVDVRRSGIEKQLRAMFELMLPVEASRIEERVKEVNGYRVTITMPRLTTPLFNYKVEGPDQDYEYQRTVPI